MELNNNDPIEVVLDALHLDDAAKEKTRQDLMRAVAANATRRVFESLSEAQQKLYVASMGQPEALASFLQQHVPAAVISNAIADATVEVLESFAAKMETSLDNKHLDAANDPTGE